uniref:Variant surface glycoprotein 1125.4941 n=1 Tax=Trypanosoma brucei TaxID=5691 RepID=A0A1J0RBE9_9TRYP|nr:variant surface glycoprotein 1125.4941 [Trypanosoma brucei]
MNLSYTKTHDLGSQKSGPMSRAKATTSFIFAAVLVCSQLGAATGNALKAAAWQDMCTTAEQLTKIPALATKKLDQAQAVMADYRDAAMRLTAVAATRADSGDAIVLAILGSKLLEAAEKTAGNLKTLRPLSIKAAAAGTVYGGISDFLNLLSAAHTGITCGCLNAKGDGDIMADTTELASCPIDNEIDLEKDTTGLETVVGDKGFKTLKTTDVKATSTSNTKCVLFQDASAVGNNKLFQKAATFLIAGGTLKVNSAGPTMTTAHGAALAAEQSTAGGKLITQAHAAIKELLSQAETAPASAAKTKVKALAADSNFSKVVVNKLKLIGMEGSGNTLEHNAKVKIKNLLADGCKNFDSKWQALIDTPIYDGKSEKIKTEKASSISSTTEIIQSVLYYQTKQQTDFLRLQKELEKTQNDCEKKPQKPE